MGSALGSTVRQRGHTVLWASSGRSEATAGRAASAGLVDVGSTGEIALRSDVIVSVCPPHAAAEVAESVSAYQGIYLDANAISPRARGRSRRRSKCRRPLCRRGHRRDRRHVRAAPRASTCRRPRLRCSQTCSQAARSKRSSSRPTSATPPPSRWRTPRGRRSAALLLAIRDLARSKTWNRRCSRSGGRRCQSSRSSPSAQRSPPQPKGGAGLARWRRSRRRSRPLISRRDSTARRPRSFAGRTAADREPLRR